MRVVIVDDELPARDSLRGLLVDSGKVEVVGEGGDGRLGFRLCAELAPDAAFLDVQLPGPDGLSLAARLLTLPRPPLVVFVTGFTGHAVDAFVVEAVDYLLKPIDADQVLRAVRRLELRLGALPPAAEPAAEPAGDRLPVRLPDEQTVRLLSRSDLVAAIRRRRRTWLHTAGEEIPTHYTLSAVADWLGGPPFLQVARDAIVNMDTVTEVIHRGDRCYRLQLPDRPRTVVAASRSGAARLAPFLKPPI